MLSPARPERCPDCGTQFPAEGVLGGLCPQCLLSLALRESETDLADAETAALGLTLARDRDLGRCVFVVLDLPLRPASEAERPDGVEPLADVVKVSGPHSAKIAELLANCWIAPDFETARRAALLARSVVATPDGDVFRAGRLVSGGGRRDARSTGRGRLLRSCGGWRRLQRS